MLSSGFIDNKICNAILHKMLSLGCIDLLTPKGLKYKIKYKILDTNALWLCIMSYLYPSCRYTD